MLMVFTSLSQNSHKVMQHKTTIPPSELIKKKLLNPLKIFISVWMINDFRITKDLCIIAEQNPLNEKSKYQVYASKPLQNKD